MDSIDEFEFKPLSQGLGFHKKPEPPKAKSVKAQSLTSGQAQFQPQSQSQPQAPSIKSTLAKATSSVESSLITPPLPRPSYPGEKEKPTVPFFPQKKKTDPVDDILKSLHKNKNMSFDMGVEVKNKIPNVKTDTYKLSPWIFSTTILDGMLVTALTLLAMILVLVITKIDLIRVLTTSESDPSVYLATLLLFSSMAFIYLFGSRLIMGSTPGEWAYDLRIGNPKNQNSMDYVLQVFARSILVILTGFVFFPILSLIFKKDILGHLTRAALYKKN